MKSRAAVPRLAGTPVAQNDRARRRKEVVVVRASWVSQWERGARAVPAQHSRFLALLSARTSAICVQTDDRVLALTFDDGPDPRFTPYVLDAVSAAGARATFFMLSDSARQHPELVRRVISEGHEVALHGVDHARTTGWGMREAARRLQRGKNELEEITQRPVSLYRPTYGAQRSGLIRVARQLGLETVIWSGWAQDWLEDRPHIVTERAVRACHPGGILLLHDTLAGLQPGEDPTIRSPEISRLLLDRLVRDSWELIGVSELLDRYVHIRSAWFERPSLKGSH